MKITFTGHRPKDLFGTYTPTPEQINKLMKMILDTIIPLIRNEKETTFITGGAIGVDQYAFYCAHKVKEKRPSTQNVLAVPFLYQDNKWYTKDKKAYQWVKEKADDVVYVDELAAYRIKKLDEKIYHPAKMQKRNEYMVDHADVVIAVWNGKEDGGTWNCIEYAVKQNKRIIHIHPEKGLQGELFVS